MRKVICVFSFCFFIILCVSSIWLNSHGAGFIRSDIKQLLRQRLYNINPLPPGKKVDVIYILGGSQKSLEYKFKTVGEIFDQRISKRLWVLDHQGKTEFNPTLKRNLTNNEWALMKLIDFGVSKEYIEFIKVDEGFFGTLSEARDISKLLETKGIKSIMLIAQPYHTQRVWLCFSHFLKDKNVSLYVQDSNQKVFLRHLLVEYIKLKIYHIILMC